MTMREACSTCNICDFLPEQKGHRVLNHQGDGVAPVLVIDDLYDKKYLPDVFTVLNELLSGFWPTYNYTNAIRCDWEPDEIAPEDLNKATQRCSVWTHSLLMERAVIISTVTGLHQMKILDKEPGAIFRSAKYGLILCVPPLLEIGVKGEMGMYRSKVERIMRESGILERVVKA